MNRRIKMLLVGLGLLVTLLLGCAFYLWMRYVRPVNFFFEQQAKTTPLFDALNKKVFDEFSHPEGVELIRAGFLGNGIPGGSHGLMLRADYSVVDDTLSLSDIRSYYEDQFAKNGWEQRSSPDDEYRLFYARGTACIDITIIMNSRYREYELEIWHDFLAQDFSPELPPLDLLKIFDGYETWIMTCP
jgi:hypothetical protein